MKRPAFFIAIGMLLAFAMLAGIAIVASNALAGTRLREMGNGDIDVTIALSRPTVDLPIAGTASGASAALHQRDLEYEEKLREMVRMAQTAAPALIAPDPTDDATSEPIQVATATRRVVPTGLPVMTHTPVPQPTEQKREDRREPEPSHTPQPQSAAPAPTNDDKGGDRKTPEPPPSQPPAQPPAQPLPPAPTDDRGGDDDSSNDNRGPSPSNTPKPDEHHDESDNGGRDKPPDPPREPKP